MIVKHLANALLAAEGMTIGSRDVGRVLKDIKVSATENGHVFMRANYASLRMYLDKYRRFFTYEFQPGFRDYPIRLNLEECRKANLIDDSNYDLKVARDTGRAVSQEGNEMTTDSHDDDDEEVQDDDLEEEEKEENEDEEAEEEENGYLNYKYNDDGIDCKSNEPADVIEHDQKYWEQLTKEELKSRLRELGETLSGTKAQLIERIMTSKRVKSMASRIS